MTEIFITDIQDKSQADRISNAIRQDFMDCKINFDFNEAELSFPCGHTILRVENKDFDITQIIATIKNLGINCEILEDKICI